jgi:hypothetical protein
VEKIIGRNPDRSNFLSQRTDALDSTLPAFQHFMRDFTNTRNPKRWKVFWIVIMVDRVVRHVCILSDEHKYTVRNMTDTAHVMIAQCRQSTTLPAACIHPRLA